MINDKTLLFRPVRSSHKATTKTKNALLGNVILENINDEGMIVSLYIYNKQNIIASLF